MVKNLVFLAGPHRSDSAEVDYFFHRHAQEDNANGLKGWLWPTVSEILPGEPHQTFENFFWNSHNNTIQDVLMNGIEESWKLSEHGIIVGAEGFDNTRGDPNSAGLKTMNRIVENLGVEAKNVYVVMLYKSPRLEQWVNLFEHNSNGNYQDFVCNEEYAEHLANIPMNPFMLASVYREQGWNVATIDTVGAHMNGSDVGHSIACDLMPMVDCDDGWIRELKGELTETELIDLNNFEALPDMQKNELEGMFLARDCHYRKLLENDEAFHALHKQNIWNECELSENAESRYEELSDPGHFFDLIQVQAGCVPSKLENVSLPGPHGYDKTSLIDDTSDPFKWDGTTIFVVVVAAVSLLYSLYNVAGRMKKQRPRRVKSPREHWLDFSDDAFNLQSPSNEDGDEPKFSDVDLRSPAMRNAENTPDAHSTLSAAAREGRSVRQKIAFQDLSPSKTKGDSRIESEIKILERELV